jgi:hypothetical protein
MSTTAEFNNMINEHLTYDLLKGEYLERAWLINNVEKDLKWLGGDVIVPFKGAQASSIKFGGLTDENDVSKYKYVRGKVTTQPEAWATLKFDHKDLMRHGKVNEQNFLQMLPDQLEEMMDYFKMVSSIQMMSGAAFAKATDDTNAATGVFVVDKIDHFELDQKCVLDDSVEVQVDVYVIAIDVNTNEVTFSLTRGGGAANLSIYAVADGAAFYHDGVLVGGTPTNMFASMKDILLSVANGGSANYLGFSKLAYPYLQALNIPGAAITEANLVPKLFDALTTLRGKARGQGDTFVMSYKHLGSVMKYIETQKGPFKVSAGQTKASLYGWTEIEITSVKGVVKIVGVVECPDDVIYLLSLKAWKFHSNGLFQKRTSPDGNTFYEVRTTSGYFYLVDICLMGELVCSSLISNAIIFGISYP